MNKSISCSDHTQLGDRKRQSRAFLLRQPATQAMPDSFCCRMLTKMLSIIGHAQPYTPERMQNIFYDQAWVHCSVHLTRQLQQLFMVEAGWFLSLQCRCKHHQG
eukprot:gene3548-6160_t